MSSTDTKFEEDLKQASNEYNRKVANEIRQIKSTLSSLNPMSADNVRHNINELKSSNPNISNQLLSLMDSILEDVKRIEKAEQQATAMREVINQNILVAEQALAKREAELKREHEDRIVKTARLQERYDRIEFGFKTLLEQDSKIHDKILKGEGLSDSEKAKFTGIPRNEAEREKFAQDDILKREAWDLHYKLKDNHQKISSYSKNKVQDYQKDLDSGRYQTQEEISQARKEQQAHQEVCEKSEAALNRLKPNDEAREKEREALVQAIKIYGPEMCKNRVSEHFQHHEEHYQQNPEHKSTKEFDDILKAVGLDKVKLSKSGKLAQESSVTSHQTSDNVKNKPVIQGNMPAVQSTVEKFIQAFKANTIIETKQINQPSKETIHPTASTKPIDKCTKLAAQAAHIAEKNGTPLLNKPSLVPSLNKSEGLAAKAARIAEKKACQTR